jgi:hypothetical protein
MASAVASWKSVTTVRRISHYWPGLGKGLGKGFTRI